MKLKLLYPSVLIGVLMLSGCADPEDASSTEAGTPRDDATANKSEPTPDAPGPDSGSALTHRIVFLGNSITAGYGVDETSAFPYLVQERIEANSYPFQVVNAGLSGDTSSGGLSRIDWILRDSVDVLVLELGGNDALRGVNLAVTRRNLAEIVARTRQAYAGAKIVIAGMMVPPNLGHQYTEEFRLIFPDVAREFDATLIPFLLEGVGGVEAMMQSDGIHPSARGHAVIAETVWLYLEPVLRDIVRAREEA